MQFICLPYVYQNTNAMGIGAAIALASLAAAAFGAGKSAQANREADEQLRRRQNELDTWYTKEYNQNYLDTDESKSTMRILSNQLKDQLKKSDQAGIVRGASDEAKVATTGNLTRGLQDNITRLAGYGTRYKDSLRREYQGLKGNLDNIEWQNLLGKSANWSNLSSNAMNAASGAFQADATGAFKPWEEKIGSWFRGSKKKSSYPTITV